MKALGRGLLLVGLLCLAAPVARAQTASPATTSTPAAAGTPAAASASATGLPAGADYGSLAKDKLVIRNQSASLQVLPASAAAWQTITTTVKQFLPALDVPGIELFVRDTSDASQSRGGFCYSHFTGQLSSKDQWVQGPNGTLRWYHFMVLPANNLNDGQFSYSGDVSKGLAYVLDSGSIVRLLDNCANPTLLAAPVPTHARTDKLWKPSPLLLVSARQPSAAGPHPAPDYDNANGHFFTQANGQGGAGGTGYAVVDDAAAGFWTDFQKLGGVAALGYPISQRYQLADGLTYQAFQKAILQWDPKLHASRFANVFDELTAAGRDGWLNAYKHTPPSRDWSADRGQPWAKVLANHMALLDLNPSIKTAYQGDPSALDHYGLPMGYADYGNVAVLRCQRAVFQQWKVATQFATTNQVLIANAGDDAKDAGLIPASATAPVPAPPAVLSPFEPGSAGAQLDDATLSYHLGQ
ncbi:MAG: hypothetical protein ACYDAG_18690, partial [Chloroflexota bacterium]